MNLGCEGGKGHVIEGKNGDGGSLECWEEKWGVRPLEAVWFERFNDWHINP